MSRRISSRDKIIQTAKELFYHHGFQVTSIDDILQVSGVARSNFYYHFPTKEELIIAVLELRISEYELLLVHSLQNHQLEPSARLNRFFEHICHVQAQEKLAGCPFGNMAAALPTDSTDTRNERFRKKLSVMFQLMEDSMRDCLAEGMNQGHFRSDLSPAELASFLMAVLQGLLIMAKAHQDTTPLIRGLAVAKELLNIPKKTETSG